MVSPFIKSVYGGKTSTEAATNDQNNSTQDQIVPPRRKIKMPTIDDDFTIDIDDFDEEPFDEPPVTPKVASSHHARTSTAANDFSNANDDENSGLCWTGSDLDVSRRNPSDEREKSSIDGHSVERKDDNERQKDSQVAMGVEQRDDHDTNSCIQTLVWSESELNDVKREENPTNVDQRDDFQDDPRKSSTTECREGTESSMHAVRMIEQNIRKMEENIREAEEKSSQHKRKIENNIRMMEENIREAEEKSSQHKRKIENNIRMMEENIREAEEKSAYHKKKMAAQPPPPPPPPPRRKKEPVPEDIGVRAERSTDSAMEEDQDFDDFNSAFSSVAPSVAVSVTKRTTNTSVKKSPLFAFPKNDFGEADDDADTTAGKASILTSELEARLPKGACGMLKCKSSKKSRKQKNDATLTTAKSGEDILDRFFENLEDHVCKDGDGKMRCTTATAVEEEDGLNRLFHPFVERLEKFDSVFEQLEEMACPKEQNKKKGETSATSSATTPAAFAAAKFTQLLDQLEKFDPVAKATAPCQIYGDGNPDDDDTDTETVGNEEDATQATHPSKESTDSSKASESKSPFDILERAYRRAESKVKEQKQTSFDKKDQLEQLKEKWFAARLSWKLRQQILVEAVKQNTEKAAKTTTKCADTMFSKCHPTVSKCNPTVSSVTKKKDKQQAPTVKVEDYDSETDVYHDASSIDNSDFFSMMSPSERSNIQSKLGDFKSNLLSPSEHSNIQNSSRRNSRSTMQNTMSEEDATSAMEDTTSAMSYSDHVMRSPMCMTPSSRLGLFEGLAAITEEVGSGESTTSHTGTKGDDATNKSHSGSSLKRRSTSTPTSDKSKASQLPSTPKEWLAKVKDTVETVYNVSEKILDRAQCTSSSINLTDSTSFEEDQEEKKPRRVKEQNSIIEEEDYSVSVVADDYSVSVMLEQDKSDDGEENYQSSYDDDDDLSGFETAVNTMETDERPPLLRLQQQRSGSRSIGSREENNGITTVSHSNSAHSRLSTELPEGYTLADSIRHAALSTRNANRTRAMQEPRGNKLKKDPSSHLRGQDPSSHSHSRNGLPPPVPQMQHKPDPDSKPKDGERIRSPRSSETNDTSDMTALTGSSSDVMVTQMGDSTHSRRSMVIQVETPKGKEMVEKDPIDDDGDKGTVFSYNTTSTGSTEFKDCYQDEIPSMSTMDTVPENEKPSDPEVEPNSHGENLTELREKAQESTSGASFLPSDENIVKSMALLSVSATVLQNTGNNSNQIESEVDEVESVPSAYSYPQEDIVANASEEAYKSSLKEVPSKEPLPTLNEDSEAVEESCVEERVLNNPMIDLDGNSDELDEPDSDESNNVEDEEKRVNDLMIDFDREDLVMEPNESLGEELITSGVHVVEDKRKSDELVLESMEPMMEVPGQSLMKENPLKNDDEKVVTVDSSDMLTKENPWENDDDEKGATVDSSDMLMKESALENDDEKPATVDSSGMLMKESALENDDEKPVAVDRVIEDEVAYSDKVVLELLEQEESLKSEHFPEEKVIIDDIRNKGCESGAVVLESLNQQESSKLEKFVEGQLSVDNPIAEGTDDLDEFVMELLTKQSSVEENLKEESSSEERGLVEDPVAEFLTKIDPITMDPTDNADKTEPQLTTLDAPKLQTSLDECEGDGELVSSPTKRLLTKLRARRSVEDRHRRLFQQQFEQNVNLDSPKATKPTEEEEDIPIVMEEDDDDVKSTLTTKKVASKLREPRSVEDRRRRRLRQRRKFEKFLGGDDYSSMSSSTMSSHSQSVTGSETVGDAEPLISASFDTGFDPIPIVEEGK